MTTVRLEPAAPRFLVKHSTTEPLCSLTSCSNIDLDHDVPPKFLIMDFYRRIIEW